MTDPGLESHRAPLSPLMRGLWKLAVAAVTLVATVAIGNAFIAPDRAVAGNMLGHDFLAFYTAGTFVREGRSADLYDLEAVKAFEDPLIAREGLPVESTSTFAPWWNPPFYALLFAPLSRLSFKAALGVWWAAGAISLIGAIVLMIRWLPRPFRTDWRYAGLAAILIGVSMPAILAATHGQNTFISLLIICAAITFWRSRRAFSAGLIAGLLCYKPQLAAVIAAGMVLSLGRRALLGLCISGGGLLGLTLIAMPGALMDYLHRLPVNVRFMQVQNTYLWERHVTLKGFWRLLLLGRDAAEATPAVQLWTWATAALLAAALGALLWRRRDANSGGVDDLIAATLVTMPLLMPFYFDYDLLLLAAPAVLLGASRLARPNPPALDRGLIAAWIALGAWMPFNPAVGGHWHVNGTVILLAVVAAMTLARALGRAADPAAMSDQPDADHSDHSDHGDSGAANDKRPWAEGIAA